MSLPFRIEDVGGSNEFISPFGIIRHSRDSGHGHGGIDIPLNGNAPIYAVADGTIFSAEESSDGAGGFDVKLLISGSGGEGWGFLYEHVKLETEIAVGSTVTKGQLIARNGLNTDHRNNHLQLSYMFNDYTFFRDQRCWVDHLDPSSKSSLLDYFDSMKTTEQFIAQWETATEEGMNAYKELLNRERFLEGPQLCYSLGLDVRVPHNEQPITTTDPSQIDDHSNGIADDQEQVAQDQAAETPAEDAQTSTDSESSGESSSAIPECTNQMFTVPPVDLNVVYEITPLGNLGPPGHTLPTEHMYLHISAGGTSTNKVPLRAPGEIYITDISGGKDINQGEFSMKFALCKDVFGYFRGTLKKCVNSQAVYPLSEQHGLEAQERR